MKALVVYGTRYGTAAEIAEEIAFFYINTNLPTSTIMFIRHI